MFGPGYGTQTTAPTGWAPGLRPKKNERPEPNKAERNVLLVCKRGPVISEDSLTEAVRAKQLHKHCSGVESAAARRLSSRPLVRTPRWLPYENALNVLRRG